MNVDICNLFRAIVLPDEEKYKFLPRVKGEHDYFFRFIVTYFPEIVHMTSFNKYYYAMRNYYFRVKSRGFLEIIDDDYISNIERFVTYSTEYAYIYNILGKNLSTIAVLAKYEGELSDQQYRDFLRCSFDCFLSKLEGKKTKISEPPFLTYNNDNEYSYDNYICYSLIEDYIRANQDKINDYSRFINKYEGIKNITIPISIILSIENNNFILFKELLSLRRKHVKIWEYSFYRSQELDLPFYYNEITKTAAKTRQLIYLVYFLAEYCDPDEYLGAFNYNEDEKIILTVLTASKIAFELSEEELVEKVKNYESNYTFEALRELGVSLEIIKRFGSPKMLEAMSTVDV